MKRDRTQRRLDQLRAIRHAPTTAGAPEILIECLAEPSNYVAARAASLVEEAQLFGLSDHLVAAFGRFMVDPGKLDRGCEALTAIAKALYGLDRHHPEVYLKGLRHRQPEGGFGEPTDSAQALRGICALGVSQTRHPDTLDELVLALTDESASVRANVARAIGCATGADTAIPLLKLKLYIGDRDPDVLTECMSALLAISVSRCIDPVLQQLDSPGSGRSEAAAIALGTIRDDRAFDALHGKWKRTVTPDVRERILKAMAMSRTEKAITFLLDLAANEVPRTAILAAKALLIHQHDPRILKMLQDVAAARKEIAQILVEAGAGTARFSG